MSASTPQEVFGPVISSYSRAQAIEDGVLVDVSKMAKEAGFIFNVAVTRAVWDGYITPDERSRPLGQSEDGRLWDTLWMLRMAIKRLQAQGQLYYRLYYIQKARQKRLVTLKAHCGPGDQGEPVITIMLPEED
ncbi:MAG: DUF6573 family protein [Pseudomonadota bacterium]